MVRGMLRRLESEVAIGLSRLDSTIQFLVSIGLGQDAGLSKGGGLKGKEKLGIEGLNFRPMRGFKPKWAASSSLGAKGAKSNSSLKVLKMALSPILRGEPSLDRSSSSAKLVGNLLSARGIFELLTGELGPPRTVLARGGVENGVDSGNPAVGNFKELLIGDRDSLRSVEGGMVSGCLGVVPHSSPAWSGSMGPKLAESLQVEDSEVDPVKSMVLETPRRASGCANLKCSKLLNLRIDLGKGQVSSPS